MALGSRDSSIPNAGVGVFRGPAWNPSTNEPTEHLNAELWLELWED